MYECEYTRAQASSGSSSPRAHQWVPSLDSTGLVCPGDGVISDRGRLVLCCHGTTSHRGRGASEPAAMASKGGELEHGPSAWPFTSL